MALKLRRACERSNTPPAELAQGGLEAGPALLKLGPYFRNLLRRECGVRQTNDHGVALTGVYSAAA